MATALHVVEHTDVLELTGGPVVEEDQEVGPADTRRPMEDRVDDQAATVLIAVEIERPGLVLEVDRADHRIGAREDGRGIEVHDPNGDARRRRRLSTVHAGVDRGRRRDRGVDRGRHREVELDVRPIIIFGSDLTPVVRLGHMPHEDDLGVLPLIIVVRIHHPLITRGAAEIEDGEAMGDLESIELPILVEDVDDVLPIVHLFDAGECLGRAVRRVLDCQVQGDGETTHRRSDGERAGPVRTDGSRGVTDPGEHARDAPPVQDGLRWLGHRAVLLGRRTGVGVGVAATATAAGPEANLLVGTAAGVAADLAFVAVAAALAGLGAAAGGEEEAAQQPQEHDVVELHCSFFSTFSFLVKKLPDLRIFRISPINLLSAIPRMWGWGQRFFTIDHSTLLVARGVLVVRRNRSV